MNKEEIAEVLTKIYRKELDRDDISIVPSIKIDELPVCDSLTHVRILVAAEVYFGIEIRPGEIQILRNTNMLIEKIFTFINK